MLADMVYDFRFTLSQHCLWSMTALLYMQVLQNDETCTLFTPPSGVVTVVNSTNAMLAAVRRGDHHIEIRAHLDLTVLGSNWMNPGFGEIPYSVKSIQVCVMNDWARNKLPVVAGKHIL